ncbi:MAG: sigma-54 dependent transcriptional regulator [Planctomycetaceae bacterium]|nr:sigma-54 dependent transcriptional regulator [Planctomycetaceae bacterium]
MGQTPDRTLLIIDDEESICFAFERFFSRRGWSVRVASTAAAGLAAYRKAAADVVFVDVRLSDGSGLDVLESLLKDDPAARVIVMTAYGTLETVTRAVRGKAFEYLVKPIDLDRSAELAQRALDSRRTPPPAVAQDGPASAMVGSSPAMQDVYKRVALVAAADGAVLILGATGTGKELVARAIHTHSRRSAGPFVAVNCGALPQPLVESELFGHVRGAFTGADADRAGRFEAADGGTLFLDEVGELPPETQVKLLRVLDCQTIERVGSVKPISLDVRVIAATNRNLEAAIAAGHFRADLYYRLAVMRIELPTLAQRGGDILPLARHFIAARAAGGASQGLDAAAASALEAYPWPGNVRELKNAIEHAVALAGAGPILLEHLPQTLRQPSAAAAPPDMPQQYVKGVHAQAGDLYRAAIEPIEAAVIRQALQQCSGNQSDAAQLLGLHRNTLRKKIRELGIE